MSEKFNCKIIVKCDVPTQHCRPLEVNHEGTFEEVEREIKENKYFLTKLAHAWRANRGCNYGTIKIVISKYNGTNKDTIRQNVRNAFVDAVSETTSDMINKKTPFVPQGVISF